MNFGVLTILLLEEKSKPRKNKSEGTLKGIRQAYDNVVDKIEDAHADKDPVSKSAIDALDVSEHMKKKMKRWFATNKKPKPLSRVKKLEQELVKVMGIGKSKAAELINDGLKNINQLHTKKWKAKLNSTTRAYLSLKPNDHIPYETIHSLETKMKAGFTDYKWWIVGSYRRHAPFSSDIDILLVDPDDDHVKAFGSLMKFFNKSYTTFGYSKGSKKLSMLVDLMTGQEDEKKSTYVKIDVFLCTPESEYPFLVYSTGSREKTIEMRTKFKKGIMHGDKLHKYKLDQYHLWDITDEPTIIPVGSEQELFELAQMDYLPPEQR